MLQETRPDSVVRPASAPPEFGGGARPRQSRRWLLGAIGLAVMLAGAAFGASIAWSDAVLSADPSALAHLAIGPLGGRLRTLSATADGHSIAVALGRDGASVLPRGKVAPGESITLSAVVERPRALGWLLGTTTSARTVVTTPAARVRSRWITVKPGDAVQVQFDQPVVTAAAVTAGGQTKQLALGGAQRQVALGARTATGTLRVAVAARSWERLGAATAVSWFPDSAQPVVVSDPAPGGTITPSQAIRLTFSRPVRDVLGAATPTVSPTVKGGHWTHPDAHTIVYHQGLAGLGLGSQLSVTLPKSIRVATDGGAVGDAQRTLDWTVPPGSTLRLQQLLAQAGYLPVNWTPDGDDVAKTSAAEARAAVEAPKGEFSWRYSHTPSELKKQWTPGTQDQITRGAIMMFQDRHHLTVDAFAGEQVWKALIADAIAGKRKTDGYSYVYVHRDTPQLLTLWHNGKVVTTSPGNTGIKEAPTELGTFPVFEHLPVTTMSGTNPDGSHYNDPGIKWVSYFNGGEALHTFNRASFGTPQSLGCVELPEAAAKKIYPYTPIGTLVTIEH